MKLDGLDHPKTLDLAARLDVSLPQAIGHLELLWAFVAQKTPRGNVGKWPDGAIARASHWTADPTVFVTALVDAGFIDRCDVHRLTVHDWRDHCPRWVASKLSRANQTICSGECSSDCTQDSTSESKPSLAKPSLTTADAVELDAKNGDEPTSDGEPDQEVPKRLPEPPEETAPTEPSEPEDPVLIELPAISGNSVPIRESHVVEFSVAYPAVDVAAKLREIRAWCIANPKRRKTERGMLRFVNSWLAREQDRGGNNRGQNQPGPRGASAVDRMQRSIERTAQRP